MPIQLVKEDGQRKYLTTEERIRFIQATKQAKPIERTFCLMLVNTGCLISEALNIKYQDINLAERTVSIHTLRRRKAEMPIREIPLSDYYLDDLIHVHKLNHQNTNSSDARLWKWSRVNGFKKVKDAMLIAGIEGYHATPFGVRHSFGLHCVQRGIPITFIKNWMGHSSLETTQMYFFNAMQDERALAERMWS